MVMAKEYNTLKHTIELPHKYAAGPAWTRFYDGLKQEKIYGSRCQECKKVFVPARSYCPACQVSADEWIEVSQEGKVISWALSISHEFFGMPVSPPFITALIRLDDTDCDFLHFIGGIDLSDAKKVKDLIRPGLKVRAIWNEEKKGHMMDIKHFAPVSG